MNLSAIKPHAIYRDTAGNHRKVLKVGRCGRSYADDVQFEVVAEAPAPHAGLPIGTIAITRITAFAGWAVQRVSPTDSGETETQPKTLFREGDVVEWTSQAGGNSTIKRGTIFAIVQPLQQPEAVLGVKRLSDFRQAVVRFDGHARPELSFLVLVAYASRARPRLYWPRANALQLVEPAPVISPTATESNAEDHAPDTGVSAAAATIRLYIGRRSGKGRVHIDNGFHKATCNEYVTITGSDEANAWIHVARPTNEHALCARCDRLATDALAKTPTTENTGFARHYMNGKAEDTVHRTYRRDNASPARSLCDNALVRTRIGRVPSSFHFCPAPSRPRDVCTACNCIAKIDPILTLYADVCAISIEDAILRRQRQHLAIQAASQR